MLGEWCWIVSENPLVKRGTGNGVKATFRDLANPWIALALSFGLGLAPWMPGTFGAVGAFVLYPLLMHLPTLTQCAVALALLALGCVVCGRAASLLGSADPSSIVWDETVGMLIVLIFTPATLLSWIVGFIAFRVLDIKKPLLIGAAERRLRGGLAIMVDDALAGLAAAGIVWIMLAAISRFTTV